jgi:Flp pilus assembly protein TadD
MKPTTHATTLLLVVTIAAVGCSRNAATSQDKAVTPIEASRPIETPKPIGEDDVGEDTTPKFAGPVTFGDGEAAYQARKYSDAIAIFQRYTEQRPKNAWGHYMLGLSAWKGGDPRKAEQAFEDALAIDPAHAKTLLNESRLFIEQNRHDEAIDRLTRGAEADPESMVVFRLLGRAYHAKGNTEEAVKSYTKAIEVNELDAWSMNNLGMLLLEEKRFDEAVMWFTKAVDVRPSVPSFHNNLGMALEHTGRVRDAETAYREAVAADPGYAKAQKNLARVEAVRSDAKPQGK